MRTTIDIKDSLFHEAEKLTHIHKKKALVETALEELVRQKKLQKLAGMLGTKRLNLTLRGLHRMRIHARP